MFVLQRSGARRRTYTCSCPELAIKMSSGRLPAHKCWKDSKSFTEIHIKRSLQYGLAQVNLPPHQHVADCRHVKRMRRHVR